MQGVPEIGVITNLLSHGLALFLVVYFVVWVHPRESKQRRADELELRKQHREDWNAERAERRAENQEQRELLREMVNTMKSRPCIIDGHHH